MESSLLGLITKLAESGIITDSALLIMIISLLSLLYKHVFRPMFEHIKNQPTKEEIRNLLNIAGEIDKISFEELSKRVDRTLEKLDSVEEFAKDNHKDLIELKRDIDYIKQLLNQFQGHMMYGSGSRRSSDFGNRELK